MVNKIKFNVQGSVHRKYIPFDIFPTKCNFTQFNYFWETALHVSGGISTHHQEHTQLYLQYLVLFKPLLRPAATVELPLVWCGNCFFCVQLLIYVNNCTKTVQFPHHTQTSSNSSTIAAGSSNGLTSAKHCTYSCVCS